MQDGLHTVDQIKWAVTKILPAVYDDSLSYYEVLCRVVEKLNEVIDDENTQDETIAEILNNLETINGEIEDIDEFINSITETIDDTLKDYDGYANDKVLGVVNGEIRWVNKGGGGGTDDYEDLENKPQINGNELIGDKSTAELGINDVPSGGTTGQVLTKTSDGYGWSDLPSSGDMYASDYDPNDVVKDAGGIIDYVDDKLEEKQDIIVKTAENSPDESSFDVVMPDAVKGPVMSSKIKGKTVAWNQLIDPNDYAVAAVADLTWTKNNEKVTVNGTSNGNGVYNFGDTSSFVQGHKYYIAGCPIGGTSSTYYLRITGTTNYFEYGDGAIITFNNTPSATEYVRAYVLSGTTVSNITFTPQVIDLTAEGYTSAETTDVATFKAAFLKRMGYPLPQYIPYDAGSMKNVDGEYRLRGRNIWDEEWELGGIDDSTGQNVTDNTKIRSKNYVRVISGETYYGKSTGTMGVRFYDANKQFLSTVNGTDRTFEIPSNAIFLRFQIADTTTYANDICINLSDPSINGQYFPYYNGGSIDCSAAPLNGVGTAQDEVDYATGERVTKAPIIDLSTLAFAHDGTRWYATAPVGIKLPPSNNYVANIIAAKYVAYSLNYMATNTVVGIGVATNGNIYIYDSVSNTPSGELCYELATPVSSTETPQPLETQYGYNVLEPVSGGVQSAEVEVDYAHSCEWLFEKLENIEGEWKLHKPIDMENVDTILLSDLPDNYNELLIKIKGTFDSENSCYIVNNGTSNGKFDFCATKTDGTNLTRTSGVYGDGYYTSEYDNDLFIEIKLKKKLINTKDETDRVMYYGTINLFGAIDTDYGDNAIGPIVIIPDINGTDLLSVTYLNNMSGEIWYK